MTTVLDLTKEPPDEAELSGVQEILVHHGGEIDLPPLGAAPSLRSLRLNRARVPDLSPLRDLPLERLSVTARDGDLVSLAPHGTLRTLRLASAGTPVSIAPLRDLPRLSGLDLTSAEVADLDVLADLDGLRYLAMRPDQWQASTPPPALAAASLKGTVTLGAAIRWAVGLGGDTGNVVRHSGHVT
ncbi:hypothetical protein E1281_36730 [Actinomadura sp. KC345]|uniref:hypothetical protein n=1 Tax=Actinomadura sp. KC345 TaxID=2530371 RepID=UPI00105077DF|nr:hypothetical protein [Actinomadura sp. KC345]TDC42005.1 hypothetical protein E1281_36730 [Actinomadura sp. KC345]